MPNPIFIVERGKTRVNVDKVLVDKMLFILYNQTQVQRHGKLK